MIRIGAIAREMNLPALGMILVMDMGRIEIAGNSAGAGTVMVLCDDLCLEKSIHMVKKITTIDLACSQAFQGFLFNSCAFLIPLLARIV